MIPAGSGVLTTITVEGGTPCLFAEVFSGSSAVGSLDTEIIDCTTINVIYVEPVLGCTDSEACNYDLEASSDDGSCIYAEVGYDCNGDCLDGEPDCAGVCGGFAYVDDCGVCDHIPFNDNTTCFGCIDSVACNYDDTAVIDNGSCTYPEENFDCDGDCLVETDCAGTCGGDAVVDDCGECGGDGSACSQSTIDILYSSALPIGGFQFDISGANLISASGGAAAAAGFSVSASSTTNRVMGFSFSGALIPAGSGVLTTITVEGGTPCLFAEVFSGSSAVGSLDTEIIDCTTINVIYVEPVLGCTDSEACNYDLEASSDDGSCIYAEVGYDCNGDCLDGEPDCAGVCGGFASVDDCGVCDLHTV